MSEISASPRPADGKIRSHKISTRIDMTPMVDLAFLLLTFFILTTELKKNVVMEVTMPDNSENVPVPAKRVLTLVLDQDDKVYWFTGNDPKALVTNFSKEGVRKLIVEKNASIEKMLLLVKATDKARYKNLVDVLDEIEIAAIKRYAIADVTQEDLALIHESTLP